MAEHEVNLLTIHVADNSGVGAIELNHALCFAICWPVCRIGLKFLFATRRISVVDKVSPGDVYSA